MKVLTTPELLRACKVAEEAGWDNLLLSAVAVNLDPDGRHCLVSITLDYDDRATRCKALLKFTGQELPYTTVLDIPLGAFNAGQTVKEDQTKKDP